MGKIKNFLTLFILLLGTSCEYNLGDSSTINSESNMVYAPTSWSPSVIQDSLEVVFSTVPMMKKLTIKIIANENSITEGIFDLDILWLENKFHHEIRVPVIENQLYSEPFVEPDPTHSNLFNIGYLDQESQKQILYEISILGSDLHFKKIKDFYLVPKS